MKKNLFFNNLISMLTGNIGRILLQTVFFFLLARLLGVEQFGQYSAIFALITIAVPFCGLGYGNILIKEVTSKRDTLGINFYNALIVLCVFSIILTILLSFICSLLFGSKISLVFIILFCISELFLQRFLELIGQIFIAINRMKLTSYIYLMSSAARLIPVLIIIISQSKTGILINWSILYVLMLILFSIIAIKFSSSYIGSPEVNIKKIKSDLKESIFFSIGLSSQSIYNDIDKSLLGKLGTLDFTGLYSMAYKIVDMVFIPAKALLGTTYPKYFQLGSKSVKSTVSLTLKLVVFLSIYSLIALVIVNNATDIIILLLGETYKGISGILSWILLIPILRSIHYPVADALTGSGFQQVRSYIQIIIAIINTILSLNIILFFGETYIILSSIISDCLLLILLLLFYVNLIRREQIEKISL